MAIAVPFHTQFWVVESLFLSRRMRTQRPSRNRPVVGLEKRRQQMKYQGGQVEGTEDQARLGSFTDFHSSGVTQIDSKRE